MEERLGMYCRMSPFVFEQAAGHTLDEADHAVAIMGTHDRVHLPVADLLTKFDGGRALGDVPLAGETASLFGARVAFSPLRRLTQKPKQRSSSLLVPTDEPVDRLIADREPALAPQSAADLLRAQALTQEPHDESPVGGDKPLVAPRLPATTVRPVLRVTRSINVIAPGAVARDLPGDRAAMPVHEARDLGHRQGRDLLAKRCERIPLGEGDLVISHCETFLPEDFASVPDRPSSRNQFVALDL